MIKNICCLLLVAIISGLLCWNAGFMAGRHDINDRLVVTAWSDGYMQGHCEGGAAMVRVIFDYELGKTAYDLKTWEGE